LGNSSVHPRHRDLDRTEVDEIFAPDTPPAVIRATLKKRCEVGIHS
jgi:hypothetical protein